MSSDESEEPVQKKKSYVSLNFSRLEDMKHWKCNRCRQKYSLKTSHSILKRHVNIAHPSNQTTLAHLVKPASERKAGHLEDLIVQLVIKNYLPFKLVDSPEFRHLLEFLKPDVKLMSRRDLMRKLENTLDVSKTSKIEELKKTSHQIALTTDVWTSSNRKPFASVTAHYVDENHVLKSDLMAFVRLPFPHSGDHLASMLVDVIKNFSVTGKISAITTDNASNNTKALRILTSEEGPGNWLQVTHVRCLAHVLNLVVQRSLTDLTPDIQAIRTLMNFLRHPKQDQLLSETAGCLKEVYLKPLVDVETRWNSMYDMLQRAIKLKPCIIHLFRHHKDYQEFSITEASWRRLEDVMIFLKRFHEATVLLSGSKYPTLSLVVPVCEDLLKHCEASLLETSLAGLAENARDTLLRYLPDLYHRKTLLASFLDPRFKTRKVRDHVDDIVELAYQEYDARRPKDVQMLTLPAADSLLTSVFPPKKSLAANELDVFTSLDVCEPSQCPFQWWAGHISELPVLAGLAFDILSIPATSVPSEQCFSKAGDIVRKKRGRLQSSTVEMCVLLNAWLK